MYITDYVDNTKYGQSSVMDLPGILRRKVLFRSNWGTLLPGSCLHIWINKTIRFVSRVANIFQRAWQYLRL